MEGCFELAVHLASFRNIDLYRQGLYRFRVSCYTIDAGGEPLLAQFADAKTRNTAVLTLALPVAARAIPFRILEPTPVKINDNLSLEQSRYVSSDSRGDVGGDRRSGAPMDGSTLMAHPRIRECFACSTATRESN